MNCAEIDDLAGAYALRALTDDELRAVDEHLASCDRHPEFAQLVAASLELAYSAPEGDPSPQLKSRIMDAIHADLPPAVPERRRGWLTELLRGWSLPRLAPYGLAAAAIALIVLFVTVSTLSESGESSSRTVISLQDPSGAESGQVVIDSEDGVTIQVEGLAELPDDQTYQMWAITDGSPVGVGTFDTSEDGTASEELDTDFSGVDTVAITIEPAGGSPQPTSDPILTADVSSA